MFCHTGRNKAGTDSLTKAVCRSTDIQNRYGRITVEVVGHFLCSAIFMQNKGKRA